MKNQITNWMQNWLCWASLGGALIVDKIYYVRDCPVLKVVLVENTRQPIPVDFRAVVQRVGRILIDLLIRYGRQSSQSLISWWLKVDWSGNSRWDGRRCVVSEVRLTQLNILLCRLQLVTVIVGDDCVVVVMVDVVRHNGCACDNARGGARIGLIQWDERRWRVVGRVRSLVVRQIGDFWRKILCRNCWRPKHKFLLHLMSREEVRWLEVFAANAVVPRNIPLDAQHLYPLLSARRKESINTGTDMRSVIKLLIHHILKIDSQIVIFKHQNTSASSLKWWN